MTLRKKVGEVFTPRSSQVNSEMYIHRESLEKNLFRSINGSMHSFLFGESGNGKSWLYKKVFKDNSINYVVANCANASRKNSILEEIYSLSAKVGESIKTGYNETKKAEVSALVAKGGLSHEGQYSVLQEDKLITAFSNFNSQSKDLNSKHVIVLDNVETIFKNNSLMSELSDIIILLDDERYEKYNIKILIVGVPNGVMQYFSAAKNPQRFRTFTFILSINIVTFF